MKNTVLNGKPNARNSHARFAWLPPQEGGLAAAPWCPCDVSAKVGEAEVRVRVRTDCPFGETIALSADPSFRTDYKIDEKTALTSVKVVRKPIMYNHKS